MNDSGVLTYEKVMLTFRLSPELYNQMRKKVNIKKDEVRSYSINQYLTELVMKDLAKKKK